MGSFWIVLSTFFISSAYVSIKAMPVSMAFYEIFLLRSIVVLTVAICLVVATKTTLKTHEPALQLSRALCGVGALSINILVARHILLSTAQTLQYTGPLFLGLWVFGWYLFKGKKIPWMLFVFLIIGFAGVLLVLRPVVADQNALYVGLGLLSGALRSGSSISLRLLGLKGEPPIRTLFWFALACTLSGGAATLMFSTGLRAEHVFSVPVLLMGVFTALGQWTQNIGWKKGKTLLCASLQFSAVIFAVIFGYLFFDEVPDTFTFLGILIIVAASLGATIFRLKYYKEG